MYMSKWKHSPAKEEKKKVVASMRTNIFLIPIFISGNWSPTCLRTLHLWSNLRIIWPWVWNWRNESFAPEWPNGLSHKWSCFAWSSLGRLQLHSILKGNLDRNFICFRLIHILKQSNFPNKCLHKVMALSEMDFALPSLIMQTSYKRTMNVYERETPMPILNGFLKNIGPINVLLDLLEIHSVSLYLTLLNTLNLKW